MSNIERAVKLHRAAYRAEILRIGIITLVGYTAFELITEVGSLEALVLGIATTTIIQLTSLVWAHITIRKELEALQMKDMADLRELFNIMKENGDLDDEDKKWFKDHGVD